MSPLVHYKRSNFVRGSSRVRVFTQPFAQGKDFDESRDLFADSVFSLDAPSVVEIHKKVCIRGVNLGNLVLHG